MGSFGGARRQLGVKLYWHKKYRMLVQGMKIISASQARSVSRTASIEIEISDASTVLDVCCRRVAGVALHFLKLYNGKTGQRHFYTWYILKIISVVVGVVLAVFVVVPHSTCSLYSSTRITFFFS